MNPKEFFSKVCAMRKAQKAYFATRDHIALRQSMALEKEVDAEIARVARITHIEEQQKKE